ncbi:hypothetical protein IEQ34_008265 [Dendrobium chrysotoxum]|uniref:Uncharacterized protein n=1 Tax=Dendrobium chrysotoxum TaxID=161865 RepID=A0AAV7H856_DENCH|nr:hypothetical protein IEQ34_008265 [Dendrobium chrysotoxum]
MMSWFHFQIRQKQLKSFQSLPSSLESLSSLQKLPPQLRNIPVSLEQLNLVCLESLQYLNSLISTHCSLHSLYIYEVPMLRELPNLPPSLKFLTIHQCHPELKGAQDCSHSSYPTALRKISKYISKLLEECNPSINNLIITATEVCEIAFVLSQRPSLPWKKDRRKPKKEEEKPKKEEDRRYQANSRRHRRQRRKRPNACGRPSLAATRFVRKKSAAVVP